MAAHSWMRERWNGTAWAQVPPMVASQIEAFAWLGNVERDAGGTWQRSTNGNVTETCQAGSGYRCRIRPV